MSKTSKVMVLTTAAVISGLAANASATWLAGEGADGEQMSQQAGITNSTSANLGNKDSPANQDPAGNSSDSAPKPQTFNTNEFIFMYANQDGNFYISTNKQDWALKDNGVLRAPSQDEIAKKDAFVRDNKLDLDAMVAASLETRRMRQPETKQTNYDNFIEQQKQQVQTRDSWTNYSLTDAMKETLRPYTAVRFNRETRDYEVTFPNGTKKLLKPNQTFEYTILETKINQMIESAGKKQEPATDEWLVYNVPADIPYPYKDTIRKNKKSGNYDIVMKNGAKKTVVSGSLEYPTIDRLVATLTPVQPVQKKEPQQQEGQIRVYSPSVIETIDNKLGVPGSILLDRSSSTNAGVVMNSFFYNDTRYRSEILSQVFRAEHVGQNILNAYMELIDVGTGRFTDNWITTYDSKNQSMIFIRFYKDTNGTNYGRGAIEIRGNDQNFTAMVYTVDAGQNINLKVYGSMNGTPTTPIVQNNVPEQLIEKYSAIVNRAIIK